MGNIIGYWSLILESDFCHKVHVCFYVSVDGCQYCQQQLSVFSQLIYMYSMILHFKLQCTCTKFKNKTMIRFLFNYNKCFEFCCSCHHVPTCTVEFRLLEPSISVSLGLTDIEY